MKTKISLHEQRVHRQSESWFYVIMAIIAIAIAIAGFGPAALSTASRRAPMTWALVSHGAIFGAWLLLFLTQTILVTKRKIAVHRRLGYLGALFAVLMVLSGYITAIAMARRGYDLSGDLIQGNNDPLELLVFQLGDILSFSILVGLAIWYRRNPEVHKRLMLLATVGSLMPAALTHIIGHSPVLREITAPIIVIPLFMLLFAGAVHDRLSRGSIHPISLWVALALFVWANLRGAVIGPSDVWHNFAEWLIK
jgi:uncharacterized membrane protein YozB (DUF420 family)